MIQGVIRCLGGKVLSEVFYHLARDYRNHKSGFPDLLMWDTRNERLKVGNHITERNMEERKKGRKKERKKRRKERREKKE